MLYYLKSLRQLLRIDSKNASPLWLVRRSSRYRITFHVTSYPLSKTLPDTQETQLGNEQIACPRINTLVNSAPLTIQSSILAVQLMILNAAFTALCNFTIKPETSKKRGGTIIIKIRNAVSMERKSVGACLRG